MTLEAEKARMSNKQEVPGGFFKMNKMLASIL